MWRALSGFRWEYVAAILGMTATAVICFQAADIYQVQVFRGQLRQMTRMISSWAFVFLLFIGASFFAKLGGEVSRLWLSAFFFVGLAALIAERLFLRSMVRGWARQGRLDRRTIIVGADQNGEKLVEALKAQDNSDIDILGVFDDRNDNRALETCAGSAKLGKVDDIVEFARRTRIDLVLFALPISAVSALIEHHFTPQFYLDLEGSVGQLKWSNQGGGCYIYGFGCGAAQFAQGALSPSATTWLVGADLGWNPVNNLNFDLELMYQSTNQQTPSGFIGTVYNTGGVGGAYLVPGDWHGVSDGFAGRFRVTRYF